MVEKNIERDHSIDILRGIAVILVCLLHVADKLCMNAKTTMLYNVIWSIQMPVFFVISGYVNKYSSKKTVREALVKKTSSYLLPWFMWTFLIKWMLYPIKDIYTPIQILWDMDLGYWFLFTLWMISVAFVISKYLTNTIVKQESELKWGGVLCFSVLYCMMLIFYGVIAFVFGFEFLGMKYVLYYMVFYYLGYIYSVYENAIKRKFPYKIKECIIALATISFAFLIGHYNFVTIDDNLHGIVLRAVCSIMGCISFFSLIIIKENGILGRTLIWIGNNTLEIYVVHLLIVGAIDIQNKMNFMSCQGILSVLSISLVVIIVSCIISTMLNKNSILKKVFCGK